MKVVKIPRSRTVRMPKILVVSEVVSLVLGPGIGEIEYGVLAALSSLKLYLSIRLNTEFKVPPEGFALKSY